MKYIQNLTKTNLVIGRLEIAPGKSGEITDAEVESDQVMYAVRSDWAKVSDVRLKDLDLSLPEVEFARPAIMGFATVEEATQKPEPLPEAPAEEPAKPVKKGKAAEAKAETKAEEKAGE